MPMKSYKCLDILNNNGIAYQFTPFDQGATAHCLNPSWQGSCNILSHEWMYRKICVEDPCEVVTYKITDSQYPHPMITGDNATTGDDVQSIITSMKKAYTQSFTKQDEVDYDDVYKDFYIPTPLDDSIDNLLNYISQKKFHYGLITTHLRYFKKSEPFEPSSHDSRHLISFVKRDDIISFFDPNYGEITFNHYSDFRVWFKEEVKNGVLNYIFPAENNKKKRSTLADLYPGIEFTNEQMQSNSWAMILGKIRLNRGEAKKNIKNFIVLPYQMQCFSGETYINPSKEINAAEINANYSASQIEQNMTINLKL